MRDARTRTKPAVSVVSDVYAAISAVDIAALVRLLDEQCVVSQDPALPWGGRYEGHDGFGQFAVTLRSNIESKVRIEAMFAAEGDVFVSGRTIGTTVATGTRFDIPIAHRWTVRDGRAVTAHFAIDTAAMLHALFNGSPRPTR
jgi:ketosteroid isomerase-like protein